MASDQLWESVIRQTEHELLEVNDVNDPDKIKSSAAPKFMNAHDITAFIEVTAQSHGCSAQNISYYYEPIICEDGCVSLDELVLVFSLKSLVNGELIDRPIHRIRIIVPQEVQQRARAMLDVRHLSQSPNIVAGAASSASSSKSGDTQEHEDLSHPPKASVPTSDSQQLALASPPAGESAVAPASAPASAPAKRKTRKPRGSRVSKQTSTPNI